MPAELRRPWPVADDRCEIIVEGGRVFERFPCYSNTSSGIPVWTHMSRRELGRLGEFEPATTPAGDAAEPSMLSSEDSGPARAAGPSTRRDAVIKQRASGAAGAQCERILALFAAHPTRDYTRQELARALFLGVNVVCARVDEIRDRIFIAQRRRCSVTNSYVEALKLKVEQQMELVA